MPDIHEEPNSQESHGISCNSELSAVVNEASLPDRLHALANYENDPRLGRRLQRRVAAERRTLLYRSNHGEVAELAATTPIEAILLDPMVPQLDGDDQVIRVKQILEGTGSADGRLQGPLQALASAGVFALAVLLLNKMSGDLPMVAVVVGTLLGLALTVDVATKVVDARRSTALSFEEAMRLAAATRASNGPRSARRQPEQSLEESSPDSQTRTNTGDSGQLTVAQARQTLIDLHSEWLAYKLDTEAWYLTKPLLRDTTGTVPTTVAYENAMHDLATAVEDLVDDAPQHRINTVGQLADTAWSAWYAANEYATKTGLGDRTPTERAALERLAKLVDRLTRASTGDPELPLVKREIQSCLDKISTVAVSWRDIAELPAIEAAGILAGLPSGRSA
ncbi:hypothetical protein [Mycolicibacterium alvei]|uniref:Uncharacterized protein n=1 Tax=Mycolicibacterium alvei TaxID=67081 RepID=A0A6N4V2Q8_9MYCO|nr:hypothetical protein [Mycolicibacterium alvei]MCV7003481.1 hypothetical protein [Mycolicibacterium alvei]BBX30565.1 hypothetical protein MALV_56900 [Mycolicibacterium alvei]